MQQWSSSQNVLTSPLWCPLLPLSTTLIVLTVSLPVSALSLPTGKVNCLPLQFHAVFPLPLSAPTLEPSLTPAQVWQSGSGSTVGGGLGSYNWVGSGTPATLAGLFAIFLYSRYKQLSLHHRVGSQRAVVLGEHTVQRTQGISGFMKMPRLIEVQQLQCLRSACSPTLNGFSLTSSLGQFLEVVIIKSLLTFLKAQTQSLLWLSLSPMSCPGWCPMCSSIILCMEIPSPRACRMPYPCMGNLASIPRCTISGATARELCGPGSPTGFNHLACSSFLPANVPNVYVWTPGK